MDLGAHKHRSPTSAREWAFGAILLVTCLMVFTAWLPKMPQSSLDPSWMFAMNQALSQHLKIGTDVVFSFGPYASIYTRSYHPATDHLMVLGGLYLGFCCFFASYLVFHKSPLLLQAGLIIVLSVFLNTLDPLLFYYPLLAGVLICTWRLHGDTSRDVFTTAIVLSPLGLLPLVKFSTLGACIGVMALLFVLLLYRRQPVLALSALLVPLLSLTLFWVVAGQALSGLPHYFRTGADIIAGYTAAMALSGSTEQTIYYVLGSIALVIALWRGRTEDRLSGRICLGLMFLGLLWVVFKASFVRHDAHAAIGGSFLFLAALVAATLVASNFHRLVIAFGFAYGLMIFIDIVPWQQALYQESMQQAQISGWRGIWRRLFDPGKMDADFSASLARLRTEARLPVLPGTSDIYSHEQTLLVASGNLWNPRPVFQSYSAYTPYLAELNRLHLLGKNLPDNIFFRVEPIDARLPSLEDGPSWRNLLKGYAPAASNHRYLILNRRDQGLELVPQSVSIVEGRIGETLAIPAYQGLVFAHLELEETLLGKIWSLFYKSGQLAITLVTSDGQERVYRLIPAMARSEFLLSPLVKETADFGMLFAAGEVKGQEVKSMRIEDPEWLSGWNTSYRVELTATPYQGDEAYLAAIDEIRTSD